MWKQLGYTGFGERRREGVGGVEGARRDAGWWRGGGGSGAGEAGIRSIITRVLRLPFTSSLTPG